MEEIQSASWESPYIKVRLRQFIANEKFAAFPHSANLKATSYLFIFLISQNPRRKNVCTLSKGTLATTKAFSPSYEDYHPRTSTLDLPESRTTRGKLQTQRQSTPLPKRTTQALLPKEMDQIRPKKDPGEIATKAGRKMALCHKKARQMDHPIYAQDTKGHTARQTIWSPLQRSLEICAFQRWHLADTIRKDLAARKKLL